MANLFMQRCRLHYYPWRQKGDLNRFEGAPVHGQYRIQRRTPVIEYTFDSRRLQVKDEHICDLD
jgi:hypothetical protein